LLAIHTPF